MADIIEGFIDRSVELVFGHIFNALSNPVQATQILTSAVSAVSPLWCFLDDV